MGASLKARQIGFRMETSQEFGKAERTERAERPERVEMTNWPFLSFYESIKMNIKYKGDRGMSNRKNLRVYEFR